MKMDSAIEVFAASSGFKGRKPGGKADKNPHKLLAKAKGMWGSDPDYNIQLSREIEAECPHMKAMSFEKMTPTQRRNVAARMYSKAQTRVRAARLKAKK